MPAFEERVSRAIGDRYQILRQIGAGGMGRVYLAEDRKLARKVAIKVLHPELAASVPVTRFLREIRIAAGLAHPHIVPVHDSGEAEGLLYFVMRFEEGESLRDLLDREGPLPVARAMAIARDVAEGLAYAHANGVIHRDIKPANVLLAGDHAMITDFGVARAVEAASPDGAALTEPSTTLGTPQYMSPEQASGLDEVDGRADVYSLGCVLYEMLTGEPPFGGRSSATVLASHFLREVPSVRDLRPEVPPPVVKLVSRALAKAPDDRVESGVLCQALASIQSGLDSTRFGFRARWRWLPRRARRRVALAASLLVVVLAALITMVLRPSSTPSYDSSSMVVLPFRDAITTPGEEALLVALADELTRQLNRWESVSIVPQVALTGVRFDLGIERPTLDRMDRGLAVARRLGAGGLVSLTARIRGDSARVSASVVNSNTGRAEGRSFEVSGKARDPYLIATALSNEILGLEGFRSEIEELRRQSAVPEALIEYDVGRRALEKWRLLEAERALRGATNMDTTFAMAHHLLAVTLFWEWLDGMKPGEAVGPEIALQSTRAVRSSKGLPLRDSLHVLAFNRFQAGDYESARQLYHGLLQRDSTDVYAWLLQGSLETLDPWLVPSPNGELRPRESLNVARRSFERVVRLSPGIQGAYSRLFALATDVARTADYRGAPAFQVPRDELLAPWAAQTPHQARPFWRVYLDSLVWLDASAWGALPDSVASAGADRLLEESLGILRRWAAFEPDLARPQEELARSTLLLRSRLRGPQRPARMDSLTRAALEHASRALELSSDTTSEALLQLANLRLASGDLRGARLALDLELTRRANGDGEGLPPKAVNVLLYSGRPRQALALLTSKPAHIRYYPDTVTGELVDDGGVEPILERLRILGATDVSGPLLRATFRDLMGKWTAPPDRPQWQIRLLRRVTAPRVAVALSLDPEILQSWVVDLGLGDPLWAALRPQEGDQGISLRKALVGGEDRIGDSSRFYLLGKVAREVGEDSLALRLFSHLDSLVYSIDALDPGWGLLPLSYLQRGRAYDDLGDTEDAERFYRRFTEAWADSDASEALLEEAQRRLEALSDATGPGSRLPTDRPEMQRSPARGD